jgi:hypothetical protein
LRALAGREGWAFEPNAVAYFRPRSTPWAFFRQYYRYARGDGKADLFRKRHRIRYSVYLLFLPLMFFLGLRYSHWAWGVLVSAALGYCLAPYRRLWPHLYAMRPADRLRAVLWVPAIRFIGDLAKMFVYPDGVWWRLRYRGGRSWWDQS